MKKYLFILITSLLCTVSVSAADTSAQAKKILDKAAAKVTLSTGATANFTINGGKLGNQSGTIAVKGNKFNARTANAIVWYDGKTQWLYNKKNEEVNVSTPSAATQQSMNPYKFLTMYKSGYNMSLEKTAAGENYIHLTGKGKSISEMYVLIDKAFNIKQVKMKQGNQWLTINIKGLKSKAMADNAFRFSAKDYPKAEVIDLR
ncbi:MAG: outer-membrane lipoprotein carrier protein LolA [Prevotella sp.]|nr:outer-membrane lipoprotein carrier protein LolA [Candidatus Prevotella equi]